MTFSQHIDHLLGDGFDGHIFGTFHLIFFHGIGMGLGSGHDLIAHGASIRFCNAIYVNVRIFHTRG